MIDARSFADRTATTEINDENGAAVIKISCSDFQQVQRCDGWRDWLIELLAPLADRDQVEILIGDNFLAMIRPKLCGRDVVQCSFDGALIEP